MYNFKHTIVSRRKWVKSVNELITSAPIYCLNCYYFNILQCVYLLNYWNIFFIYKYFICPIVIRGISYVNCQRALPEISIKVFMNFIRASRQNYPKLFCTYDSSSLSYSKASSFLFREFHYEIRKIINNCVDK